MNTTELERLASEATPGPWQVYKHTCVLAGPEREFAGRLVRSQLLSVSVVEEHDDINVSERQRSNAAFIVAACNSALTLCEENRRMRDALTTISKQPLMAEASMEDICDGYAYDSLVEIARTALEDVK